MPKSNTADSTRATIDAMKNMSQLRVLYIGDIMGDPGVAVVEQILPGLKTQQNIDIVIAQAENVSNGKSMLPADMQKLQHLGVDFFTGGNHTPVLPELHPLLTDPAAPVIAPANMLDAPGEGWKYISTNHGEVLVVSLLGSTVGRSVQTTNPLAKIDVILDEQKHKQRIATIVNFHGDYSSEKRVIGYYLDGRVSMVVGDHWHVPTADAMVLPGGTAHITDVGMCGTLHSSLGVKTDVIIERWRNGKVNANVLDDGPDRQFSALLVDIDVHTGLATHAQSIYQLLI